MPPKQGHTYALTNEEWRLATAPLIDELETVFENNRIALETATVPTLIDNERFTRTYTHPTNEAVYTWTYSVKYFPVDSTAPAPFTRAFLEFNLDLKVVLTLPPRQTYHWKQYVNRVIDTTFYQYLDIA
jgi:hypothetical protein